MEYNFNEIERKWQKRWVEMKTYQVTEDESRKKFYVLNMFPYPSGAGLHVGHPLGYIASDIYARYKRLKGYNVLNPMGYDAYGLPAEQYAIQTGQHPAVTTEANINHYREQLDKIGFSFDWTREVRTCDPVYYKWTQWAFQKMFNSFYCNTCKKAQPIETLVAHFEKQGTEGLDAAQTEELSFTADEWKAMSEKQKQQTLMNYRIAYMGETMVNWCAKLGTVLANDEVVDGVSVRGGYPVVQKKMMQWCLRVSAYAQRLLDGLDTIDWTDSLKETQKNWIGRSEGTEVEFKIAQAPSNSPRGGEKITSDGDYTKCSETIISEGDIETKWEAFKTANPSNYNLLKENAVNNRKNQTEAESALWEALKNKALGCKFRRQHIIGDFIADFICLSHRLVVEIDGGYHQTAEQKEADELRTKFLNEIGFKVIRFTNEMVLGDIDSVIECINKEIQPPSNTTSKGKMVAEKGNAPSNSPRGGETVTKEGKANIAESISNRGNFNTSPTGGGWEGASITIFTTRADTMFGVTFMVLAPESELVQQLTTAEQKAEVDEYLNYVKKRTELDRISDRKVTGVFSGSYAINPFTGDAVPVWISEYVLAGYGTGAIMAVPAHDSRDYAFAKHFNLPIIPLVEGCDVSEESFDAKEGIVCNSPKAPSKSPRGGDLEANSLPREGRGGASSLVLNGLTIKEAIAATKKYVTEHHLGRMKVNYRLRDAIFSRQRYWGEPFPVYYKDGMPYMIPESCLPLELPEVAKFLPTETGEPPLGHAKMWAWDEQNSKVVDKALIDNKTVFPLELSTMPGFAGSSAYYLRYMDPHDEEALVSEEADRYWQNVDLYVGGTEHATGHLIYSRFWNKFLFDLGVSCKEEPFQKLVNQGMIQGRSNFVYRIEGPAEAKAPSNSPRGGEAITNEGNAAICSEATNSDNSSNEGNCNASESINNEGNFTTSPTGGGKVGAFVSFNLKDQYKVTPIHVDVNIVHNDVLDTEAFRAWRPEYKDAEFILEDGKYVCGWAIEKMSKSMFNVVNPDMIVEKYGADTLRLYEMFLGPVEQSKPWDTNGIDGCHRFLKKLWALFYDTRSGEFLPNDSEPTAEQLKSVHKLIKKVSSDIEQFSYNTSISAFMICVSELQQLKCRNRELLTDLVVLIAPFAPHIAEELWHALGNDSSVCDAQWPTFDEKYLVESSVTMGIAFNGKRRFEMQFAADATNADIEKAVMDEEKTAHYIDGKQIVKVIIVPKRMVNVVVK